MAKQSNKFTVIASEENAHFLRLEKGVFGIAYDFTINKGLDALRRRVNRRKPKK